MPELKDDYGYPTAPRRIGGWWYYEERGGLRVYSGLQNGQTIAWARIEKALANHKLAIRRKTRKGRLTL